MVEPTRKDIRLPVEEGTPKFTRLPRLELMAEVNDRANTYESQGMERNIAEWLAAEDYKNQLAQDAESFAARFGDDTDRLLERLERLTFETTREMTPEVRMEFARLKQETQNNFDELRAYLAAKFKPEVQEAEREHWERPSEKFGVLEREHWERPSEKFGVLESVEPVEAERAASERIEDVVERSMQEWEDRGFLMKKVPDYSGQEVFLSGRLKSLIDTIKRTRAKIEKRAGEPLARDYQPLRLAENELRQYQAEIAELAQKQRRDLFLAQPLGQIEDRLRDGERHPRVLEHVEHVRSVDYRNRREYLTDPLSEYLSPATAEKLVSEGLTGTERSIYLDLIDGMKSLDLPEETRGVIRKAGIQIENRQHAAAAVTLREAQQSLGRRQEAAQLQLSGYIESLEQMHNDPVADSERLSRALAESLGESEFAETLKKRQTTERTLGQGKIIRWKTIRRTSGRKKEAVFSSDLDNVTGDDKVIIMQIEAVDENGNPAPDQPAVWAVAKPETSEDYKRLTIDPGATSRLEWVAGFEAMAMESDAIPPTVMRKEGLPTEMSVQEYIQDVQTDDDWNPILGPDGHPARVEPEKAYNVPDWEDKIIDQNREEIAILQLLQGTQDAGEPNYVLTEPQKGVYKAHSIDNGLSQGRFPHRKDHPDVIVSVLLAASSGKEISEPTLKKLERYRDRLDQVEAALQLAVRFDVKPLIDYKRRIVEQLLQSKQFGDYTKDYDGSWNLLREGATEQDRGRLKRKYKPESAGPETVSDQGGSAA